MRDTNQWADLSDQDKFRQSHKQSDKDSRPEALHHTLGTGANQAMPGNVIDNFIFPVSASSTYNQAEINNILSALKKMQGS